MLNDCGVIFVYLYVFVATWDDTLCLVYSDLCPKQVSALTQYTTYGLIRYMRVAAVSAFCYQGNASWKSGMGAMRLLLSHSIATLCSIFNLPAGLSLSNEMQSSSTNTLFSLWCDLLPTPFVASLSAFIHPPSNPLLSTRYPPPPAPSLIRSSSMIHGSSTIFDSITSPVVEPIISD